jgi:hypothetical protein
MSDDEILRGLDWKHVLSPEELALQQRNVARMHEFLGKVIEEKLKRNEEWES